MSDDSTAVINDIEALLAAVDGEAGGRPACVVIVGGDLNGTLFDLVDGTTTCGRSADCTIPLDFTGISRNHLTITVTGNGALLEDLNSRNGTYLNNQRAVAAETLRRGDIIKLGNIAMKYIPKGDPERLTFDKLTREANTDRLTGCFNKGYLTDAVESEIKKARVTGARLALIILDLDHFKGLNDTYGHDAGDYVLREMAEVVRRKGVREKDLFARYGGEEFVVLLPETGLNSAYHIAERLRGLIEGHAFVYDGQPLKVTASLGAADLRAGVRCGTDLFKHADEALYAAKKGGRNQVQLFPVKV